MTKITAMDIFNEVKKEEQKENDMINSFQTELSIRKFASKMRKFTVINLSQATIPGNRVDTQAVVCNHRQGDKV
jgi:hypothetical protein